MTLYAESSAVVAWLLEEESASAIERLLAASDTILASDLTLIECDRVLLRAAALGELSEADAAVRRADLRTAAAQWTVLRIDSDVVERARQPFPGDPIRALDAIHLASVLVARVAVPDLGVLSLDDRIRAAARRLGLPLRPEP